MGLKPHVKSYLKNRWLTMFFSESKESQENILKDDEFRKFLNWCGAI